MSAFQPTHVFSGFSVDDLDAARKFYGEILGMPVSENPHGFPLEIGLPTGGTLFVYDKPDHVPASFTILNFAVPDVEAAVDHLNSQGVVTKIYTDPDFGTDEKGIARNGPDGSSGPEMAWFTDPAGNVLSVLSAQ